MDVAVTATIPPNLWWQVGGIWVHVTPVDDPLLRAELHRVTVDWRENRIAVEVAGNNAGARWQTHEPNTHDFARTDGASP